MTFFIIRQFLAGLALMPLFVSCSNLGEKIGPADAPDSNNEKVDSGIPTKEKGEMGESLNLSYAIRAENQPRPKVSCNLIQQVKSDKLETRIELDGELDDWTSIPYAFSSDLDLKIGVHNETVFISGSKLNSISIDKIEIEIGKLSFASSEQIKIESSSVLIYDTASQNFIENKNNFELKIPKDQAASVVHSSVWYVRLKIISNGSEIKILPLFRPSVDYNKNSDFIVTKCHLETSENGLDFDVISETNLDIEDFNPLLYNALSLSYFDHITHLINKDQRLFGGFPILLTNNIDIKNSSNVQLHNINIPEYQYTYYANDIVDDISNRIFKFFLNTMTIEKYQFESTSLSSFFSDILKYSTLFRDRNKTLLLKQYIADGLFDFNILSENSNKRLALLLADKVKVDDLLEIVKIEGIISENILFDGIREILGSSIGFENGYFNDQDFLDVYHPKHSLDDDHDGIFNYHEILIGTRPKIRDSDGDGWNDGAEYLQDSLPNMSLEYPKNVVVDGNFSDWVTLYPSLVKYDEQSDDKGCQGLVDIDVFGAALLDNSLLFGIKAKQSQGVEDLIWEVQIETDQIGTAAILRASSNNYFWELYSSEGQLVLKQDLVYGVGQRDFEAWIPTRLLSAIDSSNIQYLSLRMAVYSSRDNNYEMCDDTQWIRLAKSSRNNQSVYN